MPSESDAPRTPILWSCNLDDERLVHADVGEAVAQWADDYNGPLPETVTVYGFARMEVDAKSIARRIDDYLREYIDEDYGDPDGYWNQPKDAEIKAASLRFAEEFARLYDPWACEQVTSRVVQIADYIAEADRG